MRQTIDNLLPRNHSGKWALAFVVGLAALMILLAYLVFKQPVEFGYHSRTEAGIFEQATLVFYAIALAICFALVAVKRWPDGLYPAVILLSFSLRELDFHTRFTPENINSTRYWRSSEVDLLQKLIVAAILVTMIGVTVTFVRRNFRTWLVHLRLGFPYAISIAGALGYIAISYALDNRLDMGALDKPIVLFLSLVEEAIEVGIPILLSASLIQWAISFRPGAAAAASPG